MNYSHIIVDLSIVLLIYNYAVYPIVVMGIAKIFAAIGTKQYEPSEALCGFSVTFIIAAYNEERVIERKIENTLGLDYSKELLDILIVADGSDDGTVELIKKYENRGVRVLHLPERRGKTAALNRGVEAAKGEIIVFSDANNDFSQDAIVKLVRHFNNPIIGGVCGSKKIKKNVGRESAEGDSLYWKYETAIKIAESEIGSITGADGEIFAIRKELYEKMDEDVINDDAEITLNIVQKKYRIIYEKEAKSYEEASINILDDFNVKVRMVAGGFQTLSRHPLQTIVPLSWHAVAFFSHKVLRWLAPEFMIVALVGTYLLSDNLLYKVLFILQLPIYAMAIVGWTLRKKKTLPTFIYVPFYLCTMNAAAFMGLVRFIRGQQSTQWRKAER